MGKSLSSLWLKSFKRISKVQQRQGTQLLRSLLGTPAPVKRKASGVVGSVIKAVTAVSGVKPIKAAKAVKAKKVATPLKAAGTAKTLTPSRSVARSAPTARVRNPAAARANPKPAAGQGQWLRSFHLQPADGLLAPPHRMDYWLFVPTRSLAARKRPMPLVVMLHGCTQTAAEFAQGSRMNALAQRKGFAVLYPQQLVTVDNNRCWHWHTRRSKSLAIAQI